MQEWKQLSEEVSSPTLEAVAGAFVLVACSDGHLAAAEVERFLGVIADTHPPAALDMARLETRFRALADAVLEDFDAGRRHALAAVEKVRESRRDVELVISAARIAIVADGKLKEIEETVLQEICGVLGVNPEEA